MFSGLADLQLHVLITLSAGLLYLIGVFLVLKMTPKREESWLLTGIIILLAIIFRLGLIAPDPGVLCSDMYRYIWDGRVQANVSTPTFTRREPLNWNTCGTTGFFRK